MEEIYIFDSLSGKKILLKPITPGQVKIYACGVTTYDHFHIGHALQAIYFDVIRNYLEYVGYEVIYVRNYTDVDDKIIARAAEIKISPALLAKRMIESSEEDMKSLGCRSPNYTPKVSEMIPQIIAMIETLIGKGAAYVTNTGDVYYRVRCKNDYGKLSNRNPDDLRSGTRDIKLGVKEDELDFALWKADETEDASWSSPWGQGRPGWHIECSGMAKEFLGSSFDIHGGGRDLIFPHHENEIAQSESANDSAYASYWLHSGLLTIEKQKMSKSLGNQITLKDFVAEWPAEVLRLAFLQHHYQSNIDFCPTTFLDAQRRLFYYYKTLEQLDLVGCEHVESEAVANKDHCPDQILSDYKKCMSDNFNTAQALGQMNLHFKKANDLLKAKPSPNKSALSRSYAQSFREVFGVLGMLGEKPTDFLNLLREKILPKLGISAEEITQLIAKRDLARQKKDFKTSDLIRDELLNFGIELMDTPDGTDWRI